MAINKFFLNGKTYNADDLNRIVSFLRTDGVFGEISNSLKVVAASGTTVNIFPGIGWCDGCGIEITATETLTLPSANGKYSVEIKLTKSGNAVTDISIGYESGEVTGNHILAWVTVSSGGITNVVDKRFNSTFKGATQTVTEFPPWTIYDPKKIHNGIGEISMYCGSEGSQTERKYKMINNGIVRVPIWVSAQSSVYSGWYVKVYLNTTPIITYTTNGHQTPLDITVAKGDILRFEVYGKSTGSNRYINVQFSFTADIDTPLKYIDLDDALVGGV